MPLETSIPAPTVDGNSPVQPSKKVKHIKIGGHIETAYPLSAVMLGWRGDEKQEQTGDLQNGKDFSPPGALVSSPADGSVL